MVGMFYFNIKFLELQEKMVYLDQIFVSIFSIGEDGEEEFCRFQGCDIKVGQLCFFYCFLMCVDVFCLFQRDGMYFYIFLCFFMILFIMLVVGIVFMKFIGFFLKFGCVIFLEGRLGRRRENILIGYFFCFFQFRILGQVFLGKVLVENLCMKVVNQFIGKFGIVFVIKVDSWGWMIGE